MESIFKNNINSIFNQNNSMTENDYSEKLVGHKRMFPFKESDDGRECGAEFY